MGVCEGGRWEWERGWALKVWIGWAVRKRGIEVGYETVQRIVNDTFPKHEHGVLSEFDLLLRLDGQVEYVNARRAPVLCVCAMRANDQAEKTSKIRVVRKYFPQAP
jgi:hypothetical protein